MNGHDLVRRIIAKHGKDRYPTPEPALLKLVEELGELVQEYLRPDCDMARVRKEYGDVGLALYGLGNVLGLNLEDEMCEVVENETRRFA